ncbi:DNA-binding protein WhiA [Spiroplasma endosymbiont of Panorpa germanica]|uniref:DNA-binding protein WhiA n=1 Tax=Spiroplasma endosymbiont of Panorpa germanica TaxID=3066314 RepID=UPI0030D052B3
MSFALDVKEEIVSHTFTDEQKKAFLCGFIKYNGEILISDNQSRLILSTISNRVARTIISFIKTFYNGEILISILQSQKLKKNKVFQVTLVEDIFEFLFNFNIYNTNKSGKIIEVDYNLIQNTSLLRAYISGVFIAIGSVNSPQTSNYHLELQFGDELSTEVFKNLLEPLGFDFKSIKRKTKYVSYIKKSTAVSDFLKLIDAPNSVMKFENKRISRDMQNNINRMINIDISNQAKTLDAGQRQVTQILYLKEKNYFGFLSDKARFLANIRLERPEATFSELEEILNNNNISITKSGVSNLFKNIEKIYKNSQEGKNEKR